MEIRQYQPKDRDNVRKICADTAFPKYRDNPKKRELVCHLFIDYFLDYESDNCLVVDDNGEAVGYIVCCTNPELYEEKMKSQYNKMIGKISPIYVLFNNMCISSSRKLNKLYNGQFHINVDKAHQGMGLGPKLLNHIAVHIREKGFKYIYLITKNRKTRGYSFYKHFGFREVKKFFGGAIGLAFKTEDAKIK